MIGVLDRLDRWIDDIPPLDSPQRFGNLAFRKWGKRLEEVRTVFHGTDVKVNLSYRKPTMC